MGSNVDNFMRKIFIKTFGCQMNVRDSEVIAGLIKAADWQLAESADNADVVILNTCSVRQHAEDRVWSQIGGLVKRRTTDDERRKTDDGNRPLIGIVGCMAQNYKEEVFRRAPEVDFVVGPSDIAKIPEIIEKLMTDRKKWGQSPKAWDSPHFFKRTTDDGRRTTTEDLLKRKIWETEGQTRPEEIYHTGFYADKEHTCVVISEGCSNYCSYCVVPFVRGGLRNRAFGGILTEIKQAVDKGITKITLLGQNVNAYRDKDVDFLGLLKVVDEISGLKEFTFMTSHPRDTSLELFWAMAEYKKLTKHLHLPLQSGSDRILGLMGRGYTRKYYLDLCRNYRKIVLGGRLTTDIIVGFPTEAEKDFQDSYDLIKDVGFDAAYIFKYSPRPHAKALDMPDDVPTQEKERRHKLILDLQRRISRKEKCPLD